MNPLARLILRRKNELDATWQELATRGGFSSHTILYALAHKAEHRQVPRPETLKRLARALDVPLDVVKATAASAAGYTLQDVNVTLESAEDVRIVAQVMGEISDADRAKLRRLALAFRDEKRDRDS
jgi:transcriptional regulator with XRE-family HTH domain